MLANKIATNSVLLAMERRAAALWYLVEHMPSTVPTEVATELSGAAWEASREASNYAADTGIPRIPFSEALPLPKQGGPDDAQR